MSGPYASAVTDAMLGCMTKQHAPLLAHIDAAYGCCGVYRLTHLKSGLFYIGGSVSIRKRVSEHFYDMRTGRKAKSRQMCELYAQDGAEGWQVEVLEECKRAVLKAREQAYIDQLQPPLNKSPVANAPMRKGTKLAPEVCAQRSEAATKLWADPQYRKNAVAARVGRAFNTGYKCTPAQIENRRKAARISMMKRWYPANWQAEYVRRYPEHAGDVT